MPQPVLSAFWSVGSLVSMKFFWPPDTHAGPVAKSLSALSPISAAHQRESASPVLTPHRFPPIEHSLSSASNRADTRLGAPKAAQTSMAAPVS